MLGFYGIQTCLGFMGFVLRNVTVDFQDLSGIELRGEGRGEGDSWCKRSPGDLVDNPRAGETFLFLGRPWAFWELMKPHARTSRGYNQNLIKQSTRLDHGSARN